VGREAQRGPTHEDNVHLASDALKYLLPRPALNIDASASYPSRHPTSLSSVRFEDTTTMC